MPFVLDNSAACGWFPPQQANACTKAVSALLPDDTALIPGLFSLESANVLRSACSGGGQIAQQAQHIAADMTNPPIEIDTGPPTASAVLALALRDDLTSGDAAYLELALWLQLPIATQDAALMQAAMTAGVSVVQ